jgi:hypothetical protein
MLDGDVPEPDVDVSDLELEWYFDELDAVRAEEDRWRDEGEDRAVEQAADQDPAWLALRRRHWAWIEAKARITNARVRNLATYRLPTRSRLAPRRPRVRFRTVRARARAPSRPSDDPLPVGDHPALSAGRAA